MSDNLTVTRSKTISERKFKWRRFLSYILVFIGFVYLVLIVLLNTSWAKNKLTSRLYQKSGSDWEVGSVLWVPFGDIKLSELQTEMGAGGIHIKSLKVSPVWDELFSGRVQLAEALVEEVEVDLDLKWLMENSINDELIQEPEILKPDITKPRSQKTTSSNKLPASKLRVNSTKVQPQKPVIREAPKVDNTPNRWLKLSKLNVTIRNGDDVIQKLTDVSASIPYAGKPTDGKIQLKFDGYELTHKIQWDGRELVIEEDNGELASIRNKWKAACQINQQGMPFLLALNIPQQKLNYTLNQPNVHLGITSEKVAANFILRGSLKNVNTWRGILSVSMEQLAISEDQKTQKRINFDQARLVGSIANGEIKIPVAEAIGFKNSILANGVIHKNLYTYGVVRLITNEESRKIFDKVYHATRLIRINENPYHILAPLDTPDRRYCDIYLDGKLSNLEMRHNRSHSWQPLKLLIKKLLDFKNNELREDGLLEPIE